ncbi:MAG: hypothetical protein AAFQ89_16660, partial [Cyanobacteria bacterium J06626_18]
QTLEFAELQQLNQAVQHYLANKEIAAKRVVFHRALVDSGLVCQIKPSLLAPQTLQNPVEVQGKSVSKTIIDERR